MVLSAYLVLVYVYCIQIDFPIFSSFFFFLTLEQTSAGAVVLTDVVFWGLLVPLLSEHFKVNLVGTLYFSDVSEVNELQNVPIPILLLKFLQLRVSLVDHDVVVH